MEKYYGRKKVAAKILDYVFPLLDTYNSFDESQKLAKEFKEDSRLTIAEYLDASAKKHRHLMNAAKFADSADRVTSLCGLVAESFLSPTFAGALVVNGVEEGIELACKVPFFVYAFKADPIKAAYLLVQEIATSSIPVLGDLYDLTNKYMEVAYQIVREDAKESLKKRNSVTT